MTDALGPLLVVTDRHQAEAAGHDLVDVVAAAAAGGADAVLYREKDLSRPERWAVGQSLASVLASTSTRLVVASDAALATELEADGVHLAQADPVPANREDRVMGRSCHDADELATAARDHMDYVTMSPVFPSLSKPGYGPALGVAAGVDLLARTPGTPVAYALGGVDADNVASCLDAGFAGVAVMGAVMAAPDPQDVVGRLADIAATPRSGSPRSRQRANHATRNTMGVVR